MSLKDFRKPVFKFKGKFFTGGRIKTLFTIRSPMFRNTYYYLQFGKHTLECKLSG